MDERSDAETEKQKKKRKEGNQTAITVYHRVKFETAVNIYHRVKFESAHCLSVLSKP